MTCSLVMFPFRRLRRAYKLLLFGVGALTSFLRLPSLSALWMGWSNAMNQLIFSNHHLYLSFYGAYWVSYGLSLILRYDEKANRYRNICPSLAVMLLNCCYVVKLLSCCFIVVMLFHISSLLSCCFIFYLIKHFFHDFGCSYDRISFHWRDVPLWSLYIQVWLYVHMWMKVSLLGKL